MNSEESKLIFKNITISFSILGIFPDSEIKLNNKIKTESYDEVEIKSNLNPQKIYILKNGYYPKLIKIVNTGYYIFIKYMKLSGELHRDNDLPAEITFDKNGNIISNFYYQNSELHRNKNPAKVYYDESSQICREIYFKNGDIKMAHQMK